MEKIQVVGRRDVDFIDKTGRQVTGLSLYILIPMDGVEGMKSDKLFVSSARLSSVSHIPQVGETVCVNYDRYGRPVEFTPVKSA